MGGNYELSRSKKTTYENSQNQPKWFLEQTKYIVLNIYGRKRERQEINELSTQLEKLEKLSLIQRKDKCKSGSWGGGKISKNPKVGFWKRLNQLVNF